MLEISPRSLIIDFEDVNLVNNTEVIHLNTDKPNTYAIFDNIELLYNYVFIIIFVYRDPLYAFLGSVCMQLVYLVYGSAPRSSLINCEVIISENA